MRGTLEAPRRRGAARDRGRCRGFDAEPVARKQKGSPRAVPDSESEHAPEAIDDGAPLAITVNRTSVSESDRKTWPQDTSSARKDAKL